MLHLDIYDQGSEANSISVYDKVDRGSSRPWDGAGIEARIDESALDSYIVEFWQRNFFVRVMIEEKTEEALNSAKLFATYVSRQIG